MQVYVNARSGKEGGGRPHSTQAAERSHTLCLSRASRVDSWLAPPPAFRRSRTLCGRPWKSGSGPHDCLAARRPVGYVGARFGTFFACPP
eukprot:4711561-Prymnesium_polylepis.1